MGFKHFRIQVIIRALVLLALLAATVWGLVATNWEVTPFACALLVVAVLLELIHFLERSNRKLISFLDFISHQDFSSGRGTSGLGKSFDELSDAYQVIAEQMRRLNVEREANAQYLAAVVDHISVALLCVADDGEINLMNRQAKQMFRSPYLHTLDGLKKIDPNLPDAIKNLKTEDHNLIEVSVANERLKLAVHASNFRLLDRSYRLISFHDISDDLEQQEVESWQKLVSVLTHEIMNSVTPIISLSEVVKNKFTVEKEGAPVTDFSDSDLHDLERSIASIESRSRGLNNFVQTYRQLTSIPAPNRSNVEISVLLESLETLMSAELEKESVAFEVVGKLDGLAVNVDQQQIEQVLINLVKNAMEAVSEVESPSIRIQVETTRLSKVVIHVIDSGMGIKPEFLNQIFVPFFTTKEKGTGVGLSISRQIAVQNKGTLSVVSRPGNGAAFSLRFRQVTHVSTP